MQHLSFNNKKIRICSNYKPLYLVFQPVDRKFMMSAFHDANLKP